MNIISCLILFALFSSGLSETIVIDLKAFSPNGPKSIYNSFETLSDSVSKIKVKNIRETVGFIIIQVHTHIENVALSYNSTLILHKYISGTNVGLIWADNAKDATFYVLRDIKIEKTVQILLAITIYDENDPVPGGCNLTFDNVIAPYQIISTNHDYIAVNAQPPSAYGVSCNENHIRVDMYHMYLKEYDNSSSSYFDAIGSFLTVESIKKRGVRVPNLQGYFKYRRLYSSYVGTGEVFGIIATYKNKSSAYVPGVSYGCDISRWETDCAAPVSDFWKIFSIVIQIVGLFICFFGHKFFRFTLFTTGFTFGMFATYLAISLEGQFSHEERIVTSTVLAFFYGVAWIFFWWKFGIPLLSVYLAFLLFGILATSVVFHAGLVDVYAFNNDVNYWLTFASLVLLCLIILTLFPSYGHIFVCAFLGSYGFITSLNYYIGGNLQYILLNTYRRMTIKGFNMAVIDPPFQFYDGLLTFVWITLNVLGLIIQSRDQRGKPPFPRHRNGPILANTLSERTPLIPPEVPSAPHYVY